MLYMFRGGMEEPGGTSQSLWEWDLWKKGNQIGGKTGTSSDYVDGWYMGITKDLVTGVWVGCDERSVHFRTSGTGEGSHTALPIFGRFMEKVYRDPSTGYTYGPFPKPTVEITREYNCQTVIIPADTLTVDTTMADSLFIPPDVQIDEPKDTATQQTTPKPTDNKPVTPTPQPQTEVSTEPKTNREKRQEARRQRRAEQQNN